MAHCYLCTKKLSNENLEHIIPNALGGHLKSRLILCSKCNVKLSDIDGKLCSDLALLTNFIAPKRDNNNNSIPTIKTISNEDNYEGDNFNETYCYDLFANKFNPYKISYSLGLKDIDDILNIQIDTSIYTENFNTFMKFFTAKNKTNYLMKIIEQIKIQTFNILVSKYAKLIEIDYKNKFSELFYEEFRKQVDVDFITDDNVNHFIEIILKHIYTYNYYLYNKEVLLLIGNSASLLFSQNLKNKDEILKSLQSYIDNYKSSIAGVNEIFLVNKKDILAFLVSHYRNLLQNPEILDFFIKQDN